MSAAYIPSGHLGARRNAAEAVSSTTSGSGEGDRGSDGDGGGDEAGVLRKREEVDVGVDAALSNVLGEELAVDCSSLSRGA